MPRRSHDFQTIRSEGGLLPPDLLRRVLDPKDGLDGTTPADYGLASGERLNEVITQSWNRLRKHWAEFRAAAKNLPEGESGTGLTNDKWSVPLLRELSFGMLPASAAPEIGGKIYAINRFFGATAIHLIGCGLSLDRRAAGVRGAAIANPHGLVQDLLNRSEAHLWAILSNGLRLRILRDSQAISRQSYLEFDLEAMFDGEVFSDFVLLWLMAHATRFAAREGDRPETCWLEQWTKIAEEQGTRALGDLKQGVEKALEILGQGFVGHPKNTALRDALRTGQLALPDFHGQLLRVVYRLIFLFVAEDRTLEGLPLLHVPDDSEAARVARERYAAHYSAGRLRELAGSIRGSRHGDLWWQLNLVVGALSGEERFKAVREQLALPVLGSFLWSPDSTAALNAPSVAATDGAELANADLLDAIRNLAFTRQNHSLRPVDYKNLGAEELGGVYESLLALTPQVSGDGAKFTFAEFAGNERKTSGSYYTPDSLVQCLLDSALDPVAEEAMKGKSGAEAEKAILALKVCDPAVGSGHFLVGAAHRLARHLARIRAVAQGEGEPSPGFYQHALRDVIGRCLYGVDISPMAAELCRVSLWLEALDPGKPLSFLDHHIRVGNSLLGTTPELIAGGLPDEAFTAIEGDDKKVCAQLKKRNKAEREGFSQGDLLGGAGSGVSADLTAITAEARKLETTPDDTLDAIRRKADQFHRLVVSPEYTHAQQVADAWCATFVWPKTVATLSDVVTTQTVKQLATAPDALNLRQRQEIDRLTSQHQFFHWHLAFPEVFAEGGFDCVLGNPPWERVKIQEKEWFAERSPEIANAANAVTRKGLIEALKVSNPALYRQFELDLRTAEGESHLLRGSGRYPLCGRGDINTYSVFTENMRGLVGSCGRVGCIVPIGIATDDTTKFFFTDLITKGALVALQGFENEAFVFPGVHHSTKFCLLSISGAGICNAGATFVFFLRCVEDLRDEAREFRLSPSDLALLNPNSGTCPVFRTRRDAELTLAVYRRVPVLVREEPFENPWNITMTGMVHMANDSSEFRESTQLNRDGWERHGAVFTKPGREMVPLYESKMIHFFDHRFGTYEGQSTAQEAQGKLPETSSDQHANPTLTVSPQYWLDAEWVASAFPAGWQHKWFIGWRKIARSTDQRTLIASILPFAGFADSGFAVFPMSSPQYGLLANVCSYCTDYVLRQKLGGTNLVQFITKQLPVLPPAAYGARLRANVTKESFGDWSRPRVIELTYTAWDLAPFAKDFGVEGPPFRWDEARRFLIRAELDAAFFHQYLPSDANGDWVKAETETEEDLKRLTESFPKPRDAVAYIMDTFPIVKRKDEEKWGSYRTKEMILEIYDEMQEAVRSGGEYKTKLDPPPGDKRCCHREREQTRH